MPAYRPESERFWEKVDKSGDCWVWTASCIGRDYNYGNFWLTGGRQSVRAHIYAYEMLVGPVPEGLVLDHTCKNTRCVNPDHLEPVTNRENILRGDSPMAQQARQTHCKYGHSLEDCHILGNGRRDCRICRKDRNDARSREYRKTHG